MAGCGHCRLFFIALHRRCTIHLNGECDCPICMGMCRCKRPSPFQPTSCEAGPPSTRKFGEKRTST